MRTLYILSAFAIACAAFAPAAHAATKPVAAPKVVAVAKVQPKAVAKIVPVAVVKPVGKAISKPVMVASKSIPGWNVKTPLPGPDGFMLQILQIMYSGGSIREITGDAQE